MNILKVALVQNKAKSNDLSDNLRLDLKRDINFERERQNWVNYLHEYGIVL